MAQTKEWLFGKNLEELGEIVLGLGMPRFTARQIAAWLYKKGASQISQMTDISLRNRESLDKIYTVGTDRKSVV